MNDADKADIEALRKYARQNKGFCCFMTFCVVFSVTVRLATLIIDANQKTADDYFQEALDKAFDGTPATKAPVQTPTPNPFYSYKHGYCHGYNAGLGMKDMSKFDDKFGLYRQLRRDKVVEMLHTDNLSPEFWQGYEEAFDDAYVGIKPEYTGFDSKRHYDFNRKPLGKR